MFLGGVVPQPFRVRRASARALAPLVAGMAWARAPALLVAARVVAGSLCRRASARALAPLVAGMAWARAPALLVAAPA